MVSKCHDFIQLFFFFFFFFEFGLLDTPVLYKYYLHFTDSIDPRKRVYADSPNTLTNRFFLPVCTIVIHTYALVEVQIGKRFCFLLSQINLFSYLQTCFSLTFQSTNLPVCLYRLFSLAWAFFFESGPIRTHVCLRRE